MRWHLDALPARVSRATYQPTRNSWGPLVVPSGRYFMMGDNRDWSMDSRITGFIPHAHVRGKVLAIYYSVDPAPDRPFPRVLTAARPGRIGRVR